MTIKIGSNIASTQAQRRLGEATASLGKIYERLSSGQRINTASDDSAGLAIAADLNSKSRIFGQAIRNVSDGISVQSIADSTVSALSDITIRLKELAEQSANGTYSSTQRKAIDTEAQALAKEYFRVSRSAQFNGQRLFDGSLSNGLRLQVGVGVEGSILTHVGAKLGDGTISLGSTLVNENGKSNAVVLGDLNGDGILDLVSAGQNDAYIGLATVRLGTGNGNFGNAATYTTETNGSNALFLGDINGDGILDLVTSGSGSGGAATVRLGTGNGSFGSATSFTTESGNSYALSLGDLNGDGILDLVTAGNGGGSGRTTVRLGTGNGSFGSATSFTTESSISYALSLGDLNGDGILDLVTAGSGGGGRATIRLGTGNGSFGSPTSFNTESVSSYALSLGDLNGDGILDLVTAGESGGGTGRATVSLGTGNGSFGSSTSFTTESSQSNALSLGDLNGDGVLDLVTAGYDSSNHTLYTTVRLGSGNGSFGVAKSTQLSSGIVGGNTQSTALSIGDINGDGVSDIISSGYIYNGSSYDGKVAILLGQTRDGISPIEPFSLKSSASALQAIGLFSKTLDNLSSLRGTIGANQSRLDVANANLSSSRENFIVSGSRITDADVAQESANLIRTQILQQAATSVLAQANQGPQLALTLLR